MSLGNNDTLSHTTNPKNCYIISCPASKKTTGQTEKSGKKKDNAPENETATAKIIKKPNKQPLVPGSEKDTSDATNTAGEATNTYYYQVDSTKYSVGLPPDAKVVDLKKYIKKKHGVKNLGNIKVIFAGKDLLDDLNLAELELDGEVLFIYFPPEESVFLMTAKALKLPKEPNPTG